MKISFSPPNDNVTHTYCLTCNQEGMVTDIFVEGLQKFYCTHCHHINERALIIDPSINWWVDDTGEYWHESAGIFLYNTQGQFLFFSRTKSPYGITVPAGHVDRDELSEHAAIRELSEEVNVRVTHVSKIATQDIHGDKCRRGADVHRWHIYAAMLPAGAAIVVSDEGSQPVWLTLKQALHNNPTFAVKYIITHHAASLQRLVM